MGGERLSPRYCWRWLSGGGHGRTAAHAYTGDASDRHLLPAAKKNGRRLDAEVLQTAWAWIHSVLGGTWAACIFAKLTS